MTLVYYGSDGKFAVYLNGTVIGFGLKERNSINRASEKMVIGREYTDQDVGYGTVMVDDLKIWKQTINRGRNSGSLQLLDRQALFFF